jgi:hypothetical protein
MIGWIALAFSIAIIYTSYVVAYTYYSPAGILVVTTLALLIAGLGIVEGLVGHRSSTEQIALARKFFSSLDPLSRHFPLIFGAAFIAVAADVILTLFGLANFGVMIERNRAVATLLANGGIVTWLGLQFAPLGVAGSAFLVFRKPSIRLSVASYVIATAVYAVYVVINNLLVLARLGIILG